MNIFFKISLHFMCRKNSKWPNFSACVSVLGIAFGVISFLTVVTVLNAFQIQMKETIASINPNLTVFAPMGISDLKKTEKKILDLEKSKIEIISPFIYQESILANKKQTSSVYIRAIQGTKSSSAENLEKFIKPRNSLDLLDRKSAEEPLNVILGNELAHDLNTEINSTITLMTFEPQENRPPEINYTKLKVVGLLSVGLAQYDKRYMLMNFDDAQALFGKSDWASGFELKLRNPDSALQLSYKFSDELPYSTLAWQEIDAGLFRQISRDSAVIKFIVFIISIVGAFNILVTLGLTVIDRTKQIALLRSLGAQKKQIIGIFVSIGAVLGFFGALIGTGISLILLGALSKVPLGELNQFYYLNEIPVKFNIPLILTVFVCAILLSALGALYPAWRAAKIKPVLGLK